MNDWLHALMARVNSSKALEYMALDLNKRETIHISSPITQAKGALHYDHTN